MLKKIRELTEDLRDVITDGSHLQEKKADAIALDFTYSLGQLDGMRTVINTIEDIKSLEEENDGD